MTGTMAARRPENVNSVVSLAMPFPRRKSRQRPSDVNAATDGRIRGASFFSLDDPRTRDGNLNSFPGRSVGKFGRL